MDISDIRLEVLKLAHRIDRSPAQVVEVAEIYEQYVKGAEIPQAAAVAAEVEPKRGTLRLNKK